MHKNSYPNYNTSHGYMTEKIQRNYIADAIESKLLPENSYRIPEIISLSASNNQAKPIQFWQRYSVLGQKRIMKIVKSFYDRVYRDEPWFTSVFARIGDTAHHVRTQSSMWIDVMGGGSTYHGAEFRLNFHHKHNAFELMNKKGAERWIKLMTQTLNETENYMAKDSRVRPSLNTFLSHFIQKYATEFKFKTHGIFGPTNSPFKRKINFLNMTETEIEFMPEGELREGLIGRGLDVQKNATQSALIKMAKNL
jgi:truncated hemoglobin YjbI